MLPVSRACKWTLLELREKYPSQAQKKCLLCDSEGFRRSPEGQQQFATQTLLVHLLGVKVEQQFATQTLLVHLLGVKRKSGRIFQQRRKSGAKKDPQSTKKSHEQHQRIFWTIWGHYSLTIKQGPRVLRQIAPESSPESSAKSLLQKFLGVPFLLFLRKALLEKPVQQGIWPQPPRQAQTSEGCVERSSAWGNCAWCPLKTLTSLNYHKVRNHP